jgi:D-3-phosphoglycerate dehydrogenase / 2-oxoglutarate reductase
MKKILITTSSFGKNNPGILKSLSERGFDYILNPYGRKLTESEVSELIEQHQPVGMIAGVEPLTYNVLTKAKKLSVISRAGIGMDSVDLQAASDKGIVVTNTPDAPTIPVAELAMGMILSLLRRICVSHVGIRRGEWVRPMGKLLHGKTVGIIGCGRIGSYLACLLTPFDCLVLGYDPFIKQTKDFQLVTLEQLLSEADIVSLHIPYSQSNHHFINAQRIQRMKKGAFLINAARGGLVDEDALYQAVCSDALGGAALDCFEREPYTGHLKNLDNVLLTAHIGSYAQEGRVMMETQAVENLLKELIKAGV